MFGVAVGMPYDEPELRVLLDSQVRPIFEARGRIRVTFPKIATEPAKDVDGVDVTVQVEPGPATSSEHVSFTGAEAPGEPFAKLANLKTSQTANFDEIKAAQDRIAQSMRHSGYVQLLDGETGHQRSGQKSKYRGRRPTWPAIHPGQIANRGA